MILENALKYASCNVIVAKDFLGCHQFIYSPLSLFNK